MKPYCLNLALISAALTGGSPASAITRQLPKLPESGKPLNVVFILSDDHRYDYMGFVGKVPWLETPNMEDGPRRGLDQERVRNHLPFFSQQGLHSYGDVFAYP